MLRVDRDRTSTWKLTLFYGVVAATVAGYVGYIFAFGVNVVFWDEWAWLSFAAHPWHLSMASLWTQHTENIFFFPDVVAAVIIPITHWNSVAFMWVSAALLIGILGITVYIFWEEIKRRPLRWIPVPLIVLTLTQYQNTLWSFQIAWFMVLLALFGAVAILSRSNLSTMLLVCAALLAIVGSYSLFSGLLIWPAGFVVLLTKGRSAKWRILWCAIGLLVTIGFFAYVNWADAGSASLGYIFSHFVVVASGVLITAGSVIPNMTSGIGAISSPRITEVVGAILLGSGLSVVAIWIRRGRTSGASAFCVGLIVMGILFDLSLIPSRLAFDSLAGTASRYDTFTWPLLLGIYSYVAIHAHGQVEKRRWMLLPLSVLALLVGSAVVIGTIVGINQGRVTRTVRLTAADVLANLAAVPSTNPAPYLIPLCGFVGGQVDAAYCTGLRADAHTVEAQRMNVFSDPKEVKQLRELGVVPGGVTPQPLAVPPNLRKLENASGKSRAAWAALSATYWSEPELRQQFPETLQGAQRFLTWAIASAGAVNAKEVISREFSAPVSDAFFLEQDAFFLEQYAPIYRSWLSSGKS
jgi:hypothetical protein